METITHQQLAEEGKAAYNKGDYLSAAKLYRAAADGFSSAGDKLAWAEMKNNSSVAYLQAGDAVSALEEVKETDLVFAQACDNKRQAMALGNQGAALDKLGRLDEALEAYEKCADLLKATGEDELRAYVYKSISSIQLRRKRYLDAYATMRVGVIGIKRPSLTQKLLKSLMEIPFKLLK